MVSMEPTKASFPIQIAVVFLLKSNTSRAPAKVSCTVDMNTLSKRPVDPRIIRSISPLTTYISSPYFSCSM